MQASSASKFDVLTRLDVRSKMFIAALAAVMTIALSSLNSQLLLLQHHCFICLHSAATN